MNFSGAHRTGLADVAQTRYLVKNFSLAEWMSPWRSHDEFAENARGIPRTGLHPVRCGADVFQIARRDGRRGLKARTRARGGQGSHDGLEATAARREAACHN